MKRRRERSQRMQALRLWSWSEVVKAIPYLRSVIGSLREHYVDVLAAQRQIDKANNSKGPAKRQQIIEHQSSQEEHDRAQAKFEDSLEELNRLDVFLLDPVRGLALIPFRKGDELAWYVFDHYATRGVIGWRLHNDPIDECRPLDSAEPAAATDSATT